MTSTKIGHPLVFFFCFLRVRHGVSFALLAVCSLVLVAALLSPVLSHGPRASRFLLRVSVSTCPHRSSGLLV